MAEMLKRTPAGVQYIHHYSEADDTGAIETIQDCSKIAEYAKLARESQPGYYGKAGQEKHVMSCPKIAVDIYCRRNGITLREFMLNDEHFKRIVNDPALAAFRVAGGRV